jgi:hypothetical protein
VLSVLWLVAIWAIAAGIFLVMLAFKVKAVGGQLGDLKQKVAGGA